MGHTKTCSELKSIFAALIKQSKTPEPSSASDMPLNLLVPEGYTDGDTFVEKHEPITAVPNPALDNSEVQAVQQTADPPSDAPEQRNSVLHIYDDELTMMPTVPLTIEGHQPIEQVTNSLGNIFIDTEENTNTLIETEALGKPDTFFDTEASRRGDMSLTNHQETEPAGLVHHDSMPTGDASRGPEPAGLVRHDSMPTGDASRGPEPAGLVRHDSMPTGDASRGPDTVSISHEVKKPKLKIRVRQSAASSRAEDPVRSRNLNAQDGNNDAADHGASSSVSVDAPHRNFGENISTGNHNFEDANSCHDVGSRVTASIGRAKPTTDDGEELSKELQCTADSSKVSLPLTSDDHRSPTSTKKSDGEQQASENHVTAPALDSRRYDGGGSSAPTDLQSHGKHKEKKKDKDKDKKRKKDRHHDDPERKEQKRQKKEKKRKEKEMAKLLAEKPKTMPQIQEKRVDGVDHHPAGVESGSKKELPETRQGTVSGAKEVNNKSVYASNVEQQGAGVSKNDGGSSSAPSHKIKIKFKRKQ